MPAADIINLKYVHDIGQKVLTNIGHRTDIIHRFKHYIHTIHNVLLDGENQQHCILSIYNYKNTFSDHKCEIKLLLS